MINAITIALIGFERNLIICVLYRIYTVYTVHKCTFCTDRKKIFKTVMIGIFDTYEFNKYIIHFAVPTHPLISISVNIIIVNKYRLL